MMADVFKLAQEGNIDEIRKLSIEEIESAFAQLDKNGRTPLMMAAQGPLGHPTLRDSYYESTNQALLEKEEESYIQCIEYFLSLGFVDINQLDCFNESAIFFAVKVSRSWAITRLLLEHNADCSILNVDQESLLHIAVNSEKNAYLLAQLLIEQARLGCLVNNANIYGITPLFAICVKSSLQKLSKTYLQALDCLLEAGASVDINEYGRPASGASLDTPLHYATLDHIDVSVLKRLLSRSNRINEANIDGDTPLHQIVSMAALENEFHADAILLMVKFGADLNAENNRLLRPIEILRQKQRQQENFPKSLETLLDNADLRNSDASQSADDAQQKEKEIEGLLRQQREYDKRYNYLNEQPNDCWPQQNLASIQELYNKYAQTYEGLVQVNKGFMLDEGKIKSFKQDIWDCEKAVARLAKLLNETNHKIKNTIASRQKLINSNKLMELDSANKSLSDLRNRQLLLREVISFYETTRSFAYDKLRFPLLQKRLKVVGKKVQIRRETQVATLPSLDQSIALAQQSKVDLLRAQILFLMQYIQRPDLQVYKNHLQQMLDFVDTQAWLQQPSDTTQPPILDAFFLERVEYGLYLIKKITPFSLKEQMDKVMGEQAYSSKDELTLLKLEFYQLRRDVGWLKEQQQVLMDKYNLERMKSDALKKLNQHPNLSDFYHMVAVCIENIFTSFKAVSGGFVDPTEGRYNAARAIAGMLGDSVSIIPIIGELTSKVMKWTVCRGLEALDARNQHAIADHAGRLLTQTEVIECAQTIAFALTECYERQLRRMMTRDEWARKKDFNPKQRNQQYGPAERFAIYATVWVMDLLENVPNVHHDNSISDAIIKMISRKTPSIQVLQIWNVINDRLQSGVVPLDEGKNNCSIINLYTRSGLVTKEDRYYANNRCDPVLYDWRVGTLQDAMSLGFDDVTQLLDKNKTKISYMYSSQGFLGKVRHNSKDTSVNTKFENSR